MSREEGADTPGVDPEQLWLRCTRPRRGRKPAYSREAITAAAVDLADAEGLEAVTIRRVAARVGAGTMSLYSYAPDKETLLELMVDHVSGELSATGPPTGDWRTELKAIARLQRAHMLRHPWLPAALAARRTPGPHALAFLERALAALRPSGLDGAAKLEVFAQLTSFVAGHVAHEIARDTAARSPDRIAAEARYLAAVAADGHHPELAEALAAPGRPLTPEATFTRFLNRLIDGLDSEPADSERADAGPTGTEPADREPGPAAGPTRARLTEVGRALFAGIAPDAPLEVVPLPGELGVCLVHTVRGGGKVYVAPDETVLFAGSAIDFEQGLEAFRGGARTAWPPPGPEGNAPG